ncbi:peptide/nickel transport system permease protein [Jatrophihabitans sp. GAS493]|uniref:ABC transporter permease n=1 Tax=Jatrophihabitans sp. GAS493 TaxID=1907575 RepID=UPI000BB83674|nr:ABC transporter permease [Jatrophihabitans sp. GAS493]SOD72600.1 peptide/nickel transport system permease protein [Jatrophihabitans sp. GAS493]
MTSLSLRQPARLRALRGGMAGHRLFNRLVISAVLLLLLMAIFGPLIAPDSITTSNIRDALLPPSAQHWFGTDDQGRDVFWRVVAGARESVLSAVIVVAVYSMIGTLIAALAAVGGRVVDETLMRFTDAAMAIPTVIFGLGFAAALGPSLKSAVIALSVTAWPVTARLLRSIIRETAAMPYVEGAQVLGVSRIRLLRRHILPNSLDVLIVKWAADIGSTILVISSLSFVGVGPQPPSPEWGAMVSEGQGYIATAWWATFWPGMAIALSTMAFALFGDVVQARLSEGRK